MNARLRIVVAVSATLALLVLPIGAAAATTYNLQGVEVNPTPATFVGVLANQPGSWEAVIQHTTLDKTPGHTTTITGGSFSIFPLGGSAVTGTIDHGQLVAGQVAGSFFCTQSFAVSGFLVNGSFGGLLTHYGIRSGTSCNAFSASFTGFATIA